MSSCLTQARGLKFARVVGSSTILVVPHAGTWIEIWPPGWPGACRGVVPHAGTWIEMATSSRTYGRPPVVPHAGTWIEITGGAEHASV